MQPGFMIRRSIAANDGVAINDTSISLKEYLEGVHSSDLEYLARKSGAFITGITQVHAPIVSGVQREELRRTKIRRPHPGVESPGRKPRANTVRDREADSDNNQSMNEITREEFNAKIETIEAKMDARVESVSAKIEGFLSAQAERDKRLDAALAQISKDNGDTKTSIGSMKTTLMVTAVSTVLAIVLGLAGFNTALTSNMLSAFQIGKSSNVSTPEVLAPQPQKSQPEPNSIPQSKTGS
jgi:hypothetical protein